MRVVLAEDLYLLRDGLTRLLQAHGIDVVAAVGSGTELLDELLAQQPDVAVIDVRLPPTFTDEGLRAALEARRQLPASPSCCAGAQLKSRLPLCLPGSGRSLN